MDYYFFDVGGSTSNLQGLRVKWSNANPNWADVGLRKGEGHQDFIGKSIKLIQDSSNGNLMVSILTNTDSLLYADKNIVKLFSEFYSEGLVTIPLEILLQNNASIEEEYWLVCPTQLPEVLNYDKSKIKYFKDRKEPQWITSIEKTVFDPDKLSKAPPIFRFLEDPSKIIINQTVLDALISHGKLNNIRCTKIDQGQTGFKKEFFLLENYETEDNYSVFAENDGAGSYFFMVFCERRHQIYESPADFRSKKSAKMVGEKWVEENKSMLPKITLSENETIIIS